MDLVERYVQEVARRLPRDQREDVARELRSSLEDSLESRAGVPVDQVDEEMAIALLLEFGPPQEVADSYQSGPNYLIGPAHYPSFLRTMKIAVAVVGGLIALGLLADSAGSTHDIGALGRMGARAISDIQTGFLTVLGLVVLVFAIIERTTTPRRPSKGDWHPSDLPLLANETNQVDQTGTIVGFVLSAIALLLINFYPEWLQLRVFSNGDELSYPLLGTTLRLEAITLNLYLVLGLALAAVLLVWRSWSLQSRIADVAIHSVLVLFLSLLWANADRLLPGRSDLLEAGWPAQQASDFAEVADEVLTPALWWLLLAGTFVAAWVLVRKVIAVVRTAQHRRAEEPTAPIG